jgi:hypothetical protein
MPGTVRRAPQVLRPQSSRLRRVVMCLWAPHTGDGVFSVWEILMELSLEQIQAITDGEAVPVMVEHTPCVLLRADIYERVKAMLEIADAYPLVDETFGEGWEAPGMADYDRYDELKHQ